MFRFWHWLSCVHAKSAAFEQEAPVQSAFELHASSSFAEQTRHGHWPPSHGRVAFNTEVPVVCVTCSARPCPEMLMPGLGMQSRLYPPPPIAPPGMAGNDGLRPITSHDSPVLVPLKQMPLRTPSLGTSAVHVFPAPQSLSMMQTFVVSLLQRPPQIGHGWVVVIPRNTCVRRRAPMSEDPASRLTV